MSNLNARINQEISLLVRISYTMGLAFTSRSINVSTMRYVVKADYIKQSAFVRELLAYQMNPQGQAPVPPNLAGGYAQEEFERGIQ